MPREATKEPFMTAKDWDALADDFSTRVLEISECDIDGVIAATAKRLGGARKSATDFGCGAGGVTRLVAPYFKTVTGVDFSPKLIGAAQTRTKPKNIEYAVSDLTAAGAMDFPCDVGFCVNVLIGADEKDRDCIARNVIANIKRGGAGVFVVPSLESVMRAYQVGLQIGVQCGVSSKAAAAKINHWVNDEVVSLPQGLIEMGDVPTKHFLQDEIAELLTARGLQNIKVSRVSYPWREALDDVPRNFKAAPPWDWMAVGVKA